MALLTGTLIGGNFVIDLERLDGVVCFSFAEPKFVVDVGEGIEEVGDEMQKIHARKSHAVDVGYDAQAVVRIFFSVYRSKLAEAKSLMFDESIIFVVVYDVVVVGAHDKRVEAGVSEATAVNARRYAEHHHVVVDAMIIVFAFK